MSSASLLMTPGRTPPVLDASAIYDEAENRLHVQKAILSELV